MRWRIVMLSMMLIVLLVPVSLSGAQGNRPEHTEYTEHTDFWVPCDDVWVWGTHTVRSTRQEFWDSKGGYHNHEHFRDTFVSDDGVYELKRKFTTTRNWDDIDRQPYVVNVVGRSTWYKNDKVLAWIDENNHWTYNANGDLTAYREEYPGWTCE